MLEVCTSHTLLLGMEDKEQFKDVSVHVASEMKRDVVYMDPPHPTTDSTPSGGSTCQQSSPGVLWALFFCTAALCISVIAAVWKIRGYFSNMNAGLKMYVEQFPLRNKTVDAELLLEYEMMLQNGTDPLQVCNISFFVSQDSGNPELLSSYFSYVNELELIFSILGAIFSVIYLVVKLSTTSVLARNVNREIFEHRIATTETKEQRRTRVYLRAETLSYMLVQTLQDVPIASCAWLYYSLSTIPTGTKCAVCFDKGTLCMVDSLNDLPGPFLVVLVFISVSMLWNILLLGERWVVFYHHKLGSGSSIATAVILLTLVFAYALILASPVLYSYSNGFWESDYFITVTRAFELESFLSSLAYLGFGIWIVLVSFFLLFAGVSALNDVLCAPCIVFEVTEAFCVCAGFDPCGCCCCC